MTIGERLDGFIEATQVRWSRLRYQWRWFWMTPSERIAELNRQAIARNKSLLLPSIVLREMDEQFSRAAIFNAIRDREYDRSGNGEKIGDRVQVRRPPRYLKIDPNLEKQPPQ